MVELTSVSAGYGPKPVLQDVSFSLHPGKITAILGENGSGKTTLIKTIAGLLPICGGEIAISGKPISAYSRRELAQQVAYCPQVRPVPDMSVRRMVLHGRFPYLDFPRKYRAEDERAADAALAQFHLTDLQHRPMAELSGGMRQRAYLAMAAAQQTPVVLLDEPTTYLDLSQTAAFSGIIRDLADSGKAVAMVLHDLLLALRLADEIAVLREGRLVFFGTAQAFLESGLSRQIFGVRVCCLETDHGRRFYYDL